MKIMKQEIKQNKGGYSKEKAQEKLGIENLEIGFKILNVMITEQENKEYARVYVHTEEILPFAVKIELDSKLEKELEKVSTYDTVVFKGLEACEIKRKEAPTQVYYRAQSMEVA